MADDGQELTLSSDMSVADLQSHLMGTATIRHRNLSDLKERDAALYDLVQGEILLRLMLAHRQHVPRSNHSVEHSNKDYTPESEELAQLLCQQSGRPAVAYVDKLFEDGGAPADIFLNVLAPAAQKLGRFWEHDLCTFTDVTLGLMRLQSILRNYEVLSDQRFAQPAASAPSILIATPEGDQHMFGLKMICDLFRRDGWHVLCEPQASADYLTEAVSKSPIDVVGLSIATAIDESVLAGLIEHIRNASANPRMQVVIGGSFVSDKPDFARSIGADLLLNDANTAAAHARELLAGLEKRC